MTDFSIASWIVWALLSAVFAALTAIFAKVGVENVNSDLATFIHTIVILVVLGSILAARGLFQPIAGISPRTYVFLALSGCAALSLRRPRGAFAFLCAQRPTVCAIGSSAAMLGSVRTRSWTS